MAAAWNAMTNSFESVKLWENYPKPGGFYDFPGCSNENFFGGVKRTQSPSTTGTSVLGMVYNAGVVIAADTLGSYGSLARFRNCSRVMKVNDFTILGAGGDYADFQFIQSVIEQKVIAEECMYDDFTVKPRALHSWITRVLYNRRSSFDPIWATFIVGGMQNGKPFLGHVDKLGTAFESPHIATGYGAYLAMPMLRKAFEAKREFTLQEAIELLVNCLRILYYRDARSFYKYELAIVNNDGVRIEGPLELDSNWDIARFVRGTE